MSFFLFVQADRRDVLMHEPSYNNLVRKATEFLQKSGPGPKQDEVSAKVEDVKKSSRRQQTNDMHKSLMFYRWLKNTTTIRRT